MLINIDMLANFFLVSKFFINFFFYFKIFNNLYSQYGAQTHDHQELHAPWTKPAGPPLLIDF